MPSDTVVRARIDSRTKARAAAALDNMGLSISDAIRLMLTRVANEQEIAFLDETPNALTRKTLAEADAGKIKKFTSVDALLKDLGI
jgi:DNA-damage-inducible protein J